MDGKRVIYGLIISLTIGFVGLAWAGIKTDTIKADIYQSQTGTNSVTIAELKSAVDLKHAASGDTPLASEITVDTTNFDSNLSGADNTVQKALDTLDNMTAGGGTGTITGTGTDGKMTKWTGTTAIGDATNTNTEVASAVTNSHAGSHTGTDGKIPKFTGTNTLGDSAFTDTQMRTGHFLFNILSASALADTTICIVSELPSAITVTKLVVNDGVDPDTEIDGNIKWCSAFIDRAAGDTVIETIDTDSGVRVDSSIANPAVASGKCIYLNFDVTPIAAIKQISVDITFTIN